MSHTGEDTEPIYFWNKAFVNEWLCYGESV